MLDALHWRQQVLFVLSYFPIPYVTRRRSHAHAYTLTHAQRLHSYIRPVFCFRFVDILIGQESGLHWTTRITHDMWAFSCSVDRCMVTGLNWMSCMLAHKPTHTWSDGETHKHIHTLPIFAISRTLTTKWKPSVNEGIFWKLRDTTNW